LRRHLRSGLLVIASTIDLDCVHTDPDVLAWLRRQPRNGRLAVIPAIDPDYIRLTQRGLVVLTDGGPIPAAVFPVSILTDAPWAPPEREPEFKVFASGGLTMPWPVLEPPFLPQPTHTPAPAPGPTVDTKPLPTRKPRGKPWSPVWTEIIIPKIDPIVAEKGPYATLADAVEAVLSLMVKKKDKLKPRTIERWVNKNRPGWVAARQGGRNSV
jgi:hypothetical protein